MGCTFHGHVSMMVCLAYRCLRDGSQIGRIKIKKVRYVKIETIV